MELAHQLRLDCKHRGEGNGTAKEERGRRKLSVARIASQEQGRSTAGSLGGREPLWACGDRWTFPSDESRPRRCEECSLVGGY